jgi:hypothetical protein
MITSYWPKYAPREATVSAFQIAFEGLGYEVCEESDIEPGYDKVAIFVMSGSVTHAAVSLNGQQWRSKLGNEEDIEHPLEGIEGSAYGIAYLYLRRPAMGPLP